MFSFLSGTDIIVIKKNGIDFSSQTLSFPPISNLEEIDKESIAKSLDEFIKANKISGKKFVIFLSPEVVFNKIINVENPSEKETAVLKFLEEVPLPPEKLGKNVRYEKETTIANATNKELYELVANALSDKNEVVSVVAPSSDQMDDLKKTARDSKLLKEGNFLNELFDSPKKSNINIGLIGLLCLISLIIIVSSIYLYKNLPSPKKAPVSPVISLPTPTPIPTFAFDKKTLKIQVLNGTGTAGDAGKVAKMLTSLGYDSTTGNAASKSATVSTISFSDKVPGLISDEIFKELNKLFSKPATISGQKSENYDIVITTGK